jgi:predicted RecB family nuclease
MKRQGPHIIYSPSDLVRYAQSPFASWMNRYYLEHLDELAPDKETEDQKLIARTGDQHECAVLEEFKSSVPDLVEILKDDAAAHQDTIAAIKAQAPIIYQAALQDRQFAGFADFLILDEVGRYEVWDTKLARSPKPHYGIQLCCYSEMFAATTGEQMPEKFGIILGSKNRVEFRVEDFIHYYRRVKANFLSMQESFTGNMADRPEPLPMADHGRWTSYAEKFFDDTDHLVRVAGITVGQIKKLKGAGIGTMADLGAASGASAPKLAADSYEKLVAQARLQCQTRADRLKKRDAPARYEILPQIGANGESVGLAALPPDHTADVYFDIEGYRSVSAWSVSRVVRLPR